jgi:hypothetical protein
VDAAFAEVFGADGPHPALAEPSGLFAPLIGGWALRVFDYEPDGTVAESTAEWHFTWALNGKAVADVWINPGGIVLEGTRDGVTLRWTFSEIGPESFRWRAEETGPDRVAYVRQRFEATRVR